MDLLSPAQCVGYVALVLGVTAFLSKDDRRLKVLLSIESLAYALHFFLLGNLPATASALISSGRTYLSLWHRSLWLAAAVVTLNVGVGFSLAHGPLGWLPIVATCGATLAFFTLEGVPLRLVLLGSTSLWLVNNYLSHSVGGTILESLIAAANITTLVRTFLQSAAAAQSPDGITSPYRVQ